MSPLRRPRADDPASRAQRERILATASSLLGEERAGSTFSTDAVAARAGVARAIMQQSFGDDAGLLEALWDALLSRCLVKLPQALQQPDPRAALAELIAIYGAFWDEQRAVVRRIRAHAVLDAVLGSALRTRERDRREGMLRLSRRLAEAVPGAQPPPELADLLCMLTSFETFDGVAGPERRIAAIIPAVQSLAQSVLDHAGGARTGGRS
jgi:AcrR family transcriptional regulator